MGYGVRVDSQAGLDWYRRGMEAGDLRCLLNMARNTALTDPDAAALMFQQAVDQGYPNAHCFWAEADEENKEQHLRLAAKQGSAYAMFTYASYLLSERHAKGVWIIRTATIIPDHEEWLHEERTKCSLKKAIAWAQKNPPKASNPDQLPVAKAHVAKCKVR